jgi:HSP20 family protein
MDNERKGFDPVEEISNLRDNLRKAVDAGVRSVTSAMYPPLDIYREGDTVVVRTAPLDGLDATSIDVEMRGAELTISGTTRSTDEVVSEAYLRRERNFGQFSRTVTIPVRVQAEAASAKVKHDVLTVTFPVEPRRDDDVIDVRVAGS